MTRVDQFESVFRAADKPLFRPDPVHYSRVLVVTDLPPGLMGRFDETLRSFLPKGCGSGGFRHLAGDETRDLPALLEAVRDFGPDLVCTYRNLHSEAWRWPYSLGEAVDVLTQATGFPVLLLPHPEAGRAHDHALRDTDRVMAMSGHLSGDDSLVNAALGFAVEGGTLWLAHIEDQAEFDRLIEAIGKIPAIDTDLAREQILAQLLKEPRDYVERCAGVLRSVAGAPTVEGLVSCSRRLQEVQRLIEEHEVDLLVLHTKDDDQLAMHGMAYPLAVEVREIPLLLL